jgi:peptidoglycan/xylan/chitin deacetylase (PgdA/CDA1 family)
VKHSSSMGVAATACSLIPFPLLDACARTGLVSCYYHLVCNREVPHVKHLYAYKTIGEFKSDLEFLLKHFHPISIGEVIDFVNKGCPFPRRSLLLTFDDGFREMHDIVAPILVERGVCATFFVNSAFVDNEQMCYLNKASLIVEKLRDIKSAMVLREIASLLRSNHVEFQDVREGVLSVDYRKKDLLDVCADLVGLDYGYYLATEQPYLTTVQISKLINDGFSIGAHSIDHPLYSLLPLDDQVNQTVTSVASVREKFALDYGVFAFPHGDHNVSQEYFDKVAASRLVDLSFGTSGLLEDSAPRNIQRVNLENPRCPAAALLSYHQARKIRYALSGNDKIRRQAV